MMGMMRDEGWKMLEGEGRGELQGQRLHKRYKVNVNPQLESTLIPVQLPGGIQQKSPPAKFYLPKRRIFHAKTAILKPPDAKTASLKIRMQKVRLPGT